MPGAGVFWPTDRTMYTENIKIKQKLKNPPKSCLVTKCHRHLVKSYKKASATPFLFTGYLTCDRHWLIM